MLVKSIAFQRPRCKWPMHSIDPRLNVKNIASSGVAGPHTVAFSND